MNPNDKSKGFTLIELLVVIAIISLLASIVMSSLAAARAKARDAGRISELKQIQIAIEQFRYDKGKYPDSTNAGGNALAIHDDPGGQADNWLDAALFPSSGTKYIGQRLQRADNNLESFYLNGTALTAWGIANGAVYDYILVQQLENGGMAKSTCNNPGTDWVSFGYYCIGVPK